MGLFKWIGIGLLLINGLAIILTFIIGLFFWVRDEDDECMIRHIKG